MSACWLAGLLTGFISGFDARLSYSLTGFSSFAGCLDRWLLSWVAGWIGLLVLLGWLAVWMTSWIRFLRGWDCCLLGFSCGLAGYAWWLSFWQAGFAGCLV
jgi:hypothetical protein